MLGTKAVEIVVIKVGFVVGTVEVSDEGVTEVILYGEAERSLS